MQKNQVKKFKDSANNFVQELVVRPPTINIPDGDLLSAFNILDPQNLPTEPDRSSYGEKELTKILHHFEAHENMFDQQQSHFEWDMLKTVMDNYTHLDIGSFYRQFLLKNKDTFVNMAKLAALALSLPVTSVNCERVISSYNLIKTYRRNTLCMDSTHLINGDVGTILCAYI